jgi:hypothetical protein
MQNNKCEIHDHIASEAHRVLKKLHEITSRQIEAFDSGDRERFMKFDQELELMLGEKERTVGALRQHDEEHGCQL